MAKKFEKLNLEGIPNEYVNIKCNRYQLGTKQEIFTVERLKIAYPMINWGLTADVMGSRNYEQNRINGDIIGIKDNRIFCFLDLKVQAIGSSIMYGSIDLNSFLSFAYQSDNRRYYLMVNEFGSDFITPSYNDIVNMFKKNIKCINISKKKQRESFQKINVEWLKKYYIEEPDFVATHDYIRGDTIKQYM